MFSSDFSRLCLSLKLCQVWSTFIIIPNQTLISATCLFWHGCEKIMASLGKGLRCRKLCSDDIFSILTHGMSKLHLAVLEEVLTFLILSFLQTLFYY